MKTIIEVYFLLGSQLFKYKSKRNKNEVSNPLTQIHHTPKSFFYMRCSLHLFLSLALGLCSLYILSLENYTITLDLVYKSLSINQSLLKYTYIYIYAKCHTFKTSCKSVLSFLFCTKYTGMSE